MLKVVNLISFKEIFVFFGVIALIVVLFIVGANLFLRWAIEVEAPREEKPLEVPPPGAVKIKSPDKVELTPSVIYDGRSFIPEQVLRDGSGSIGCIVVVVNRANFPLKIGMSPHRASGDSGPEYGAVAAGDKLIFDPRFVGITELEFHNHNNPAQKFTVELGSKCQL